MQIEVGSIVQGKVSGIVPFGAFIEIDKETSGLVHISEVSEEYVDDVSKHLEVGQEVKVKVLSVDPQGKISLSIKKACENKPKKKKPQKKEPYVGIGTNPPEEIDFNFNKKEMESLSFEDKLLKFKHDSDEKISDLKRNTEGKRGGGYKRY